MIDVISYNASREVTMADFRRQPLRTEKPETERKAGKFRQFECKTCAARRHQGQSGDPPYAICHECGKYYAAGGSAVDKKV